MGQRWIKCYGDATSIPGAAPTNYFNGINIPGGPIQSIMIRLEMVAAAQVAATDVSTLLTNLRFTLNGDVVHDARYIGADNTSVQAGRSGYFYNAIGGRCAQTVDDPLAPDAWWEIPVGINLPSGNNRLEVASSWLASAAAVASGEFSVWVRYNTDLKETTLVAPSTSYTSAIALEQVVVRVPSTAGMVVDSVFIQNDADLDELGVQGVRANALGDYGFSASMMRFVTDELKNGIIFGDEGASTTAAQFATSRLGCFILPTFGLTGGDVYLQVDSTAATTRTYSPVLRGPVGSSAIGGGVQTLMVPAEPSSALVRAVEN